MNSSPRETPAEEVFEKIEESELRLLQAIWSLEAQIQELRNDIVKLAQSNEGVARRPLLHGNTSV